jgi:hypothetical protein
VWSFEPRQRFKTMAVLVDTAKAGGIKGGALASAIHAHSRHGARPCVAFAFAFGSFRFVSFRFVSSGFVSVSFSFPSFSPMMGACAMTVGVHVMMIMVHVMMIR